MERPDTQTLEEELEQFRREKEKVRRLVGQIGGTASNRRDRAMNVVFILAIAALLLLEADVSPATGAITLHAEPRHRWHPIAEDREHGHAAGGLETLPEGPYEPPDVLVALQHPARVAAQVYGCPIVREDTRVRGQDLVAGGKGGDDGPQPVAQ